MLVLSFFLTGLAASFVGVAYKVGPAKGTHKLRLTTYAFVILGVQVFMLVLSSALLVSISNRDSGHLMADFDCEVGPAEQALQPTDQCETVAPGSAPHDSASSDCKNCYAGEYCCYSGGSPLTVNDWDCALCPAGQSQESAGSLTCLSCPAGKYSEYAGAETCTACVAGRYSTAYAAISAATCLQCATGQSSTAGSTNCGLCPAGTYASGVGECQNCVPGKYSTTTGSVSESTCQNCQPTETGETTFSGYGSSTCQTCAEGTAWDNDANQCASCPFPDRCHAGQCIAGTATAGCAACRLSCSPDEVAALGDECIRPWFQTGEKCVQCPEEMPWWFTVGVTFVTFGFIWGVWHISGVEGNDDFEELVGNYDMANELGAASQTVSQTAILLGIGFPHLQMMAFLGEMDYGWPEWISQLAQSLAGLLSFDMGQLYSLECRASNDADNDSMYVVKFLTTHCVFLALYAIFMSPKAMEKLGIMDPEKKSCLDKYDFLKKLTSGEKEGVLKVHKRGTNKLIAEHSTNAMAAVYTLFVVRLVQSCATILKCTEDQFGAARLDAMPSIECTMESSSVYQHLMPMAVLLLLCYVGFAIGRLKTLHSGWKTEMDHYAKNEYNDPQVLSFQRQHAWLVLKYKVDASWYSEFVLLSHRVFIVVTALWMPSVDDTVQRTLIHSAATVLLLYWVYWEKPFFELGKSEDEFSDGDKTEIVAMICLLVVEALGLVCFTWSEEDRSPTLTTFIELTMCIASLIPLCMALVQIWRGLRDGAANKSRYHQHCVSIRDLNAGKLLIESGTSKDLIHALKTLTAAEQKHNKAYHSVRSDLSPETMQIFHSMEAPTKDSERPEDEQLSDEERSKMQAKAVEFLLAATEKMDCEENELMVNDGGHLPEGARVSVRGLGKPTAGIKAVDTELVIGRIEEWATTCPSSGHMTLMMTTKTQVEDEEGNIADEITSTIEEVTYESTVIAGNTITFGECKRGDNPIEFAIGDENVKLTAHIDIYGPGTYIKFSDHKHQVEFDDVAHHPGRTEIQFKKKNPANDPKHPEIQIFEFRLLSPREFILARAAYYKCLASALALRLDTARFLDVWAFASEDDIHFEDTLQSLKEMQDELELYTSDEYAALAPLWNFTNDKGEEPHMIPIVVEEVQTELEHLCDQLTALALKAKGETLMADKDFEGASAVFLEALRLDPSNHDIDVDPAEIAEFMGKSDAFRNATEAAKVGDFARAQELLDEAAEVAKSQPGNMYKHVLRVKKDVSKQAIVMEKVAQGKVQLAAATLAASKQDPSSARKGYTAALIILNEALHMDPQYETAQQLISEAKTGRDSLAALAARDLAESRLHEGDLIAAEVDFKAAIALDLNNEELQAEYAHVCSLNRCAEAGEKVLRGDLEEIIKRQRALQTAAELPSLREEDKSTITKALHDIDTRLLLRQAQDAIVSQGRAEKGGDRAVAERLRHALLFSPFSSRAIDQDKYPHLFEERSEMIGEAELAMENTDWETAIENYKKAWDLENEKLLLEDDDGRLAKWSAKLLIEDGDERVKSKEFERARETYLKAEAQANVAQEAGAIIHDVEVIMADVRRKIASLDALDLMANAEAATKNGNIEHAQKLLLAAIAKDPSEQKFKTALEQLEQKALAHTLLLSGKRACSKHNFIEAERDLRKAAELDPSNEGIQLALQQCLETKGSAEEALALKIQMFEKGQAAMFSGDHKSAAAALKEALGHRVVAPGSDEPSDAEKREAAGALFRRTAHRLKLGNQLARPTAAASAPEDARLQVKFTNPMAESGDESPLADLEKQLDSEPEPAAPEPEPEPESEEDPPKVGKVKKIKKKAKKVKEKAKEEAAHLTDMDLE